MDLTSENNPDLPVGAPLICERRHVRNVAQRPSSLKAQLEAQIPASEAEAEDCEGDGSGQLSEAEEHVFAIDRARFPRMMATLHAYEAFKGLTPDSDWHSVLVEQARRDHPDWCNEYVDSSEFMDFAAEFGSLTAREATAIYAKHQWWLCRYGFAEYHDE